MKHIRSMSSLRAADTGLRPCGILGPVYCDLTDAIRRAWDDFLVAKKNQ